MPRLPVLLLLLNSLKNVEKLRGKMRTLEQKIQVVRLDQVEFNLLNFFFNLHHLGPGYPGIFLEDEAGFPGVPDADAILDKAYWDAAREEGGKP